VKTYSVMRLNLIFLYGLLGFLTLVGLIVGYQALIRPDTPRAVGLMELLWLGIIVWIWWVYLRIPVSITWREEGVLEFKSLLRTVEVPVQDIIAFKATPLSWGFIRVTYNGGSLKLFTQITGLYELIGLVKARNPGVEIVGC
jgi:hypothetical protein